MKLSDINVTALNIGMTSLRFLENGVEFDPYEQFELSCPLLHTVLEECPALFGVKSPYDALSLVEDLFANGRIKLLIEPSMGCKSVIDVEIAQVNLKSDENNFVNIEL